MGWIDGMNGITPLASFPPSSSVPRFASPLSREGVRSWPRWTLTALGRSVTFSAFYESCGLGAWVPGFLEGIASLGPGGPGRLDPCALASTGPQALGYLGSCLVSLLCSKITEPSIWRHVFVRMSPILFKFTPKRIDGCFHGNQKQMLFWGGRPPPYTPSHSPCLLPPLPFGPALRMSVITRGGQELAPMDADGARTKCHMFCCLRSQKWRMQPSICLIKGKPSRLSGFPFSN